MSKLRFHVIPVIISGSRLVNGDGVLTLSVGSYPQARSEWCNFSRQFHVFTAQGVHFPAIFRVCLKKFYLSGQIIVDLWFKVNHEVFPWHICDFFSRKWSTKRKTTTFWDFSTTIFDIKCRLWMKLTPALVPLEAWFWYMLFFDLLSAKLCLGFLIELIEQILHIIKVGKILWSQAIYT
jgi:hypothetical protein